MFNRHKYYPSAIELVIYQNIQNQMNQSRYSSTPSKSHVQLPACPLCQKKYDSYYHLPRIVPKCGHTFCEKCINNRTQLKSKRKTFTCPECSIDVIMRKNLNDDVPKNQTIIDIIQDFKKNNYATNSPQIQVQCQEHKKALDMICQSCDNIRICSYCALFGEHKGHEIGGETQATSMDLKDLKQYMAIIEQELNSNLHPDSPENIQKKSKEELSSGLKKIIRIAFKTYYDRINQRQQMLLQQCDEIQISGKISNNIDRALSTYDNLKIKVENRKQCLTINQVDDIMSTAKSVHDEIEKICEQFTNNTTNYLNSAIKKINEHTFFKVQECSSSSLKQIIQEVGKIEKPSLSRYSSKPDKTSNSKYKPKIKKQEQKSVYYQSISVPDDEELLITQKKIQANSKSRQKMIDRISPISRYSQIIEPSLTPPKTAKSTINRKSVKESIPPRKDVNSRNKPTNSTKAKENSDFGKPQDLKYIKPIRQVNYELRPKLQNIIAEIERQYKESNNSLELIGCDITDTLIVYICDYLFSKGIKFSMMKLVKNSISDEGFRILLSYLMNDDFTKVLNMTANHLTNKSINYITTLVTHNNILKTIYLTHNKISPMQIKKKKDLFESNFVEVIV